MTPEREALYNAATRALEALAEDYRKQSRENAEGDFELEEVKKTQSGAVMAHWVATVSYVKIDEDDDVMNNMYVLSSPSSDVMTSLGLQRAGLIQWERCI